MALTRFLIAALLALPIAAAGNDVSVPLTAAEAREKLLLTRPDFPVVGVKRSVLDGYFEVLMQGGMILYMNETVDYFIAGDLYLHPPQISSNPNKKS